MATLARIWYLTSESSIVISSDLLLGPQVILLRTCELDRCESLSSVCAPSMMLQQNCHYTAKRHVSRKYLSDMIIYNHMNFMRNLYFSTPVTERRRLIGNVVCGMAIPNE